MNISEFLSEPIISIVMVSIAFGVGVFQGHILGKAILVKFPRLQNHVKTVSASLFFLFLANAILSIPRFASPEKVSFSKIFEITSPTEIAAFIFTIFGIGTGFVAVLAISITVISIILLKITQLDGSKKIFVLLVSAIILGITVISRFTDYTPGSWEVFLYFLYQLGITIGITGGTIRKTRKMIG